MAYIAQDPNTSSQVNTTDVLSGQNVGQTQPQSNPQQTPPQPTTSGGGSSSYVSDGNPYGKYASQGSRKAGSTPSSGSFTNVQTYVDKNKQSSEQLGKGVANTLTTTSDIARKNLQGVQNQFQQGVQSGSLEDYGNALNQAKTAYNEAATGNAGTKTWNANQASMYAPTKNEQGAYSAEDQALVDSNKARVTYGDGSTKEFNTQAEAQNAIDTYNASNPGYYTYGEQAPLSVSNQRLSDILNASYQGPNELSEIGGYNQAYNQYQDLSQLQNQALSAGPKTELLNRTFATPNTEYNTGNKLLDELLLGQGSANKILTDTAKNLGQSSTGKVGDEFSDVTRGARTLAQTQSKEMENIKNSARQALNETANTRSKEVNDRINEVISNWEKYPQYFRDRFQQELDQQGINVDLNKQYKDLETKYGTAGQTETNLSNLQNTLNPIANFDYNKMNSLQQQIKSVNPQAMDVLSSYLNSGGTNASQEAQLNSLVQNNPNLANLINQYKDQFSQFDTLRNATLNYNAYNNEGQAGANAIYDNPIDFAKNLSLADRAKLGVSSKELANLDSETSFNNLPSGTKEKITQAYLANNQNVINNYRTGLQGQISDTTSALEKLKQFNTQGVGEGFDPNAFNLGLSQLEAQALGVQGGEGLYNLLKDQGVDALLKTASADKNKLVSENEQAQLARLQSIAELAKGYGTTGSGIDYRNQFTNRDLAGTQNATSALDMENFKNLLQGAEKDFRTDASSSNIVGQGYGTGSSGGLFGTKRAQAWKTLEQNFGDILKANDGYRNMYSDQGVDTNLLKQIAQSAKGNETFNTGYVNPNLTTVAEGVSEIPANFLQNILGDSGVASKAATNYAMFSNPVTAPLALANLFGSFVGGSSAEAQAVADRAAYQNALSNLSQNITNKINTSGLKNQLGVTKNTAQDLELYKLLGMLDTTNL